MFIFGDFEANAVEGLAAVLQSWAGLPGVNVDTVSSPGSDGAFYAQSRLDSGHRVFDLYARSASPSEVLEIADEVTKFCNPSLGMQDLRIDIAPGWRWRAVVASISSWQRGKWQPGSECHLFASIEFTTPDPHGYHSPDEEWDFPGQVASAPLVRQLGNTDSFPTITIDAQLTSSQTLTVVLGGKSVTLKGPVAVGQEIVLNYQTMDFGLWSGGVKIRSLVPLMSSFERLELPVGASTLSVSSSGSVSSVQVAANSRRI